jgi:hypothetical protein
MINMASHDTKKITGRQLQAARVLAGLTAQELAHAASIGVATLKRAEARGEADVTMTANNLSAVVRALEKAGIALIERNGGGPGVRLK